MRKHVLPALILVVALACSCVPVHPESESSEVITIYVGPETAECVGVAPQTCLLVSTEPDGEYSYFYGNIEGFDYEEGYEYELLVSVEEVENPPADASGRKYTLVEVVSKEPVDP